MSRSSVWKASNASATTARSVKALVLALVPRAGAFARIYPSSPQRGLMKWQYCGREATSAKAGFVTQ